MIKSTKLLDTCVLRLRMRVQCTRCYFVTKFVCTRTFGGKQDSCIVRFLIILAKFVVTSMKALAKYVYCMLTAVLYPSLCHRHIITCDWQYVADAEFLLFCATTVRGMVFYALEMYLSVNELLIGAFQCRYEV